MPTVKDSLATPSRMNQLQPAANAPAAMPAQGPVAVVPDPTLQMSPLMHCSLPASASTFDTFAKQYYRNSQVPQTRLLPAGGQQ
jgi:hypothetical protein